MNSGGKHGAVTDLVAKNNKATASKELPQMGDSMQQGGLLLGLGLMASSLLLATRKKKANK
ncbi:LPXTG cell wall anchor domain-containing protein [uncultured Ligilactobacillus sp.]|nr:LPXTG cell wall anchor domain-containing protein [uncultured Ligilactobacillus sp.]